MGLHLANLPVSGLEFGHKPVATRQAWSVRNVQRIQGPVQLNIGARDQNVVAVVVVQYEHAILVAGP